jgi:hypothetical protein
VNAIFEKVDPPLAPSLDVRIGEQPHPHQYINRTYVLLVFKGSPGSSDDAIFE